jgi:hypothetical protein
MKELHPALIPVNRLALQGVLKGEHYKFNRKGIKNRRFWTYEPLPIAPLYVTAENIIGRKFGSNMVVVNYYGKSISKNRPMGRWIVRCVCGNYELRSAKAVKNKKNKNDCCCECKKIRTMRNSIYQRKGLNASPKTEEATQEKHQDTTQRTG